MKRPDVAQKPIGIGLGSNEFFSAIRLFGQHLVGVPQVFDQALRDQLDEPKGEAVARLEKLVEISLAELEQARRAGAGAGRRTVSPVEQTDDAEERASPMAGEHPLA